MEVIVSYLRIVAEIVLDAYGSVVVEVIAVHDCCIRQDQVYAVGAVIVDSAVSNVVVFRIVDVNAVVGGIDAVVKQDSIIRTVDVDAVVAYIRDRIVVYFSKINRGEIDAAACA